MIGMGLAIDARGRIYRRWSDGVPYTELMIGQVGGVGGQEWTFHSSDHCKSLDPAEEAEIDRVVAEWRAEQRRIYRMPASGPIPAAHAATDCDPDALLWAGHGPDDHAD